jgi:hypothetical protein
MRYKVLIFVMILMLIMAILVYSGSRSGEEINWQVLSGGGGDGSSTNYRLNGTVAQTAVGAGSSTNYGLSHGYWVNFGGMGPCDCEPGNANGDDLINIFDVTYLISFLYKDGPAPVPYAICSGDPNGLGCTCNIFDVTYLISFLYKEGPAPVTCEEWLAACGPPLR